MLAMGDHMLTVDRKVLPEVQTPAGVGWSVTICGPRWVRVTIANDGPANLYLAAKPLTLTTLDQADDVVLPSTFTTRDLGYLEGQSRLYMLSREAGVVTVAVP